MRKILYFLLTMIFLLSGCAEKESIHDISAEDFASSTGEFCIKGIEWNSPKDVVATVLPITYSENPVVESDMLSIYMSENQISVMDYMATVEVEYQNNGLNAISFHIADDNLEKAYQNLYTKLSALYGEIEESVNDLSTEERELKSKVCLWESILEQKTVLQLSYVISNGQEMLVLATGLN